MSLISLLHRPALTEMALIQNPALGAFALWKFGLAYQGREGHHVELPLMFLVLPLVLHKPTRELIVGTNRTSGLALFAGKLAENRENLLAVHERALTLRHLTLESIVLGEQSQLLSIDATRATVRANALSGTLKVPILPEQINWLIPSCERLGYWFAGLSNQQVARTLNVEF
ncbi:three component ABC system middle component [Paenalcaligenes sp. Me52]|uniref:three component ABC system middle component n=1 Tax=Paenalcaligenes sp. Me52 TaxID=3392038 RepID=UPI003D26A6D1